jgi:pyruvate/2-oxoglutarate dehydrogenase complex dihydrolipoamide acyltransferase (E2) component
VASRLKIPKMGMGVEEGTISEWLVQDGDRVIVGTPVYVLASDKVETEIESPIAGTVRLLVEAGETLAVGTVIAEIS